MSVQTQIDRLSGNVTAALAAIAEKGVEVPSGSTSDALAALIASIEAGSGGGSVSTGENCTVEIETDASAEVHYSYFANDGTLAYGVTTMTAYSTIEHTIAKGSLVYLKLGYIVSDDENTANITRLCEDESLLNYVYKVDGNGAIRHKQYGGGI